MFYFEGRVVMFLDDYVFVIVSYLFVLVKFGLVGVVFSCFNNDVIIKGRIIILFFK